eukprot:CAMPEP_0119340234 /NCGR_PEP_ID=MMETSP1333-20130426/99918_1 /TAXON_ID=418940 /ORGANISM="Scyphosphaera apsteinii, Strain RCC1455" /LENGTH=40 /DNA_ID= /DNA_START= /DNA_END= /DNA_ORIENTATION=
MAIQVEPDSVLFALVAGKEVVEAEAAVTEAKNPAQAGAKA